MKANELRIGNWVIRSMKNHDLESDRYEYQIKGKDLDLWQSHNYRPIPLTEEWLVKFGFEKINSTWYKIGNFAINISFDVEWGNNWLGIRLKYVHQLQNLYFALTGKELTK